MTRSSRMDRARSVAATLILLALVFAPAAAVTALSVRHIDSGEFRTIDAFHQPGQWLLVMVWASDCPICNRDAHEFSDFHLMHGDDDARVLGVSVDGWQGRDAAVAFVDRHQLQFDNTVVEPADFARFYRDATGQAWYGTPAFLLYGPDGELRASHIGALASDTVANYIAEAGAR